MGIASYQHVFLSRTCWHRSGAWCATTPNDLTSNPESTPVIAFLHNHFREGYFNGSISVHHGRHELKAGVESDNLFLHENFSDIITDPSRFDPGTPLQFVFRAMPVGGSVPTWSNPRIAQDLIR